MANTLKKTQQNPPAENKHDTGRANNSKKSIIKQGQIHRCNSAGPSGTRKK